MPSVPRRVVTSASEWFHGNAGPLLVAVLCTREARIKIVGMTYALDSEMLVTES